MNTFEKEQQEQTRKMDLLLKNIKKNIIELEGMLKITNDHWEYEDPIYRYYHHSFKVYYLQETTKNIVKLLTKISPNEDKTKFTPFFQAILDEGCNGIEWKHEHNVEWMKHTRPFLEAFFHAKYFLEMAVKYGWKYNEAPQLLDSGWAALLCLYDLR